MTSHKIPPVPQDHQPGDFLVFQIEAGFCLLRLLAVETEDDEKVWHLLAYNEIFPDIDAVDAALENPCSLTINIPHSALTTRAFDATQTARMKNEPLNDSELRGFVEWKKKPDALVSDLSVRLILGFR